MLWSIAEFLAGLIAVVWGADRFASGSISVAWKLGVRPVLIGLTLVSIATSAPEFLVSVNASLRGEPLLAVGNAIGSNIVNVGLVVGLVAIIRPIQINSAAVRREVSTLLAASLLMVSVFLDSYLSRADGFVLLIGLIIVLAWLTRIGLKSSAVDPIAAEVEAKIPRIASNRKTLFQLIAGLVSLLVGVEFLVAAAIDIAGTVGVSEFVVGIVLVALGTSLPELAVSLASAIKGEYGLAIGGILGSNIFNSLAVIGIASAIHPTILPSSALSLHVFVMAALTLVLFTTMFVSDGKREISRSEGWSLLVAYLVYVSYVVVPGFIERFN
jgi:cation:H+ antiporter